MLYFNKNIYIRNIRKDHLREKSGKKKISLEETKNSEFEDLY